MQAIVFLYEAYSLEEIAEHFSKLQARALEHSISAMNAKEAAMWKREASVWYRAAIVLRQTRIIEKGNEWK